MIKDLLKKNRSYRRFEENKEISYDTILGFVDNLRFCPSARNQQVIVYKIITSRELRTRIFPYLKWAGYLDNWVGPKKGEQPVAYVLFGLNKDIVEHIDKWIHTDLGIVTQTLLLQATEKNIGGCSIGAFNKIEIAKLVEMPDNIELQLVVALGYPKEEIRIEEIENNESVKYRREGEVHIVPKRKLKDILF